MEKYLVSIADVRGYDNDNNLLFTGKTLLDSSIETTLASTDIRAGKGNQLKYVYYNTAEMNIKITDAQFSLSYLALNVGSDVTTGKNVWKDETITVTSGAGTVTHTPVAVTGTTVYGYVTLSDGTVERVTFTGNAFTLSNPSVSGTLCVRYYTYDLAAQSVTVYANMMPKTIRLVMEADLASSDSTTSKIGKMEVEIPKASMTGAFTLSMTPNGVASTPLSARALATTSTVAGCSGQTIYATITEVIDSANWYDNVVALAIAGGDVSLAVSGTKTLQVFATTSNNTSFLVAADKITFATDTPAKATVAAGVVTGVAAGTAVIKATITAKPTIDANVVVTVTA